MSNLEFQDFHETRVESVNRVEDSDGEGDTYEFEHASDTGKLLPDGPSAPSGKSMWNFEYYQQFFDVDTDQVLNRLLHSCTPKFGANFITEHIRPLPDLYGPFWVCVTLVFSIAISGNVANYLQTTDDDREWAYNFHHVTAAAGVISLYVVSMPAALYAVAWHRRLAQPYTYFELLNVYAYSLFIFIPVSLLWIINVEAVRWAVILVAVIISGSTLVFSFWPAFKTDTNKAVSFGIVAGVLLVHALLAISFKEYFFAADSGASAAVAATAAPDTAMPALRAEQQSDAAGAPNVPSSPAAPPVAGVNASSSGGQQQQPMKRRVLAAAGNKAPPVAAGAAVTS